MNLQVIGLGYDLAGIVVLGGFAIFRMVNEVAAQSGTYWDYNPELMKALSYARIDTTTGTVFLVMGFSLQIASLIGVTTNQWGICLLMGGLVLAVLLYLVWLRRVLSKWLIASARKRIKEEDEARERERVKRNAAEQGELGT